MLQKGPIDTEITVKKEGRETMRRHKYIMSKCSVQKMNIFHAST
jgi:hypothetical protein